MLEENRERESEEARPGSHARKGVRGRFGALGPYHAETGYTGGMGDNYTEGSIDTPRNVCLHTLCWLSCS